MKKVLAYKILLFLLQIYRLFKKPVENQFFLLPVNCITIDLRCVALLY